MSQIHPTAIVDPKVQIGDGVEIKAYAIIEGPVTIGAGTVIHAHSMIEGHTFIGENCTIGPAAYIGLPPQHLSNPGEGTSTVIGNGSIIRESSTIHRATKRGIEFATRLGARCFLMAAAHVGHDSQLGDDVVLANAALVGGHCTIGDKVFLGGGSAIHQFCRIGRLVIVCGNEPVTHDVLPFAAVRYDGLKGYNAIGCKRSGMSRESISAVRAAFRCLHSNRTTPAVIAAIENSVPMVGEVKEMISFLLAPSKRGLQPSVRYVASPTPFDSEV